MIDVAIDMAYSSAVIFVDNVEEMPNVVNKLLSDETRLKEISEYNKMFIRQRVSIILLPNLSHL